MRSTRFCNICKEQRLGVSLEKYRARVRNLNMEKSAHNHTTHEEGAVFWRVRPMICHHGAAAPL